MPAEGLVSLTKVAATRAKARNLYTERFSGFENPLPGLKVRGWHNFGIRSPDWNAELHNRACKTLGTTGRSVQTDRLKAVRFVPNIRVKIIGHEGQHEAPEQDVDGVGKAQAGYETEGLSGQAGTGCPVG